MDVMRISYDLIAGQAWNAGKYPLAGAVLL